MRPGTNGQYVVAVLGWRGGTLPADTTFNGFYVSTTGGGAGTYQVVNTPGIQGQIGRVSLDYSRDGATLWATIEDPQIVALNGVYRSDKGTADGPWHRVADARVLSRAPNSATGRWPGLVQPVRPRGSERCRARLRRARRDLRDQ